MKITLLNHGTKLFMDFGEDEVSKNALTLSQVTKETFEIKIWEGKHKVLAQTFVSKSDFVKAAERIKAHCG